MVMKSRDLSFIERKLIYAKKRKNNLMDINILLRQLHGYNSENHVFVQFDNNIYFFNLILS